MLVKRLKPEALLPSRATEESVGLDIHAYCVSESGRPNTILIPPRQTRLVPTGLAIRPPSGWSIYVCSRSGLAKSMSVFVANGPGVIDPDYTGEIGALLYNGGHESYYVRHEDRIAQLVLLPIVDLKMTVVEDLPSTNRGESGFGSSGR